ncbi:MAG: nicotinate (nicotinamide) nucleotide adenylyltransferase [Chloroflexi bacterium HGW-Chloroflexi-9]|nr:MAG: nicotinate (nicotinamide) nucleotide adenylyltransferase [Chloroflexi bacterium HGW-Chloroflexi-9]
MAGVAGRRTGILGGTFDPPHLAHLALAEAARVALDLDRVIFVPAGDPWRKADREVSPAGARVALVQMAIEPYEWAGLSTVEVERSGPSYTADTIDELVAAGEPDEAWWFILGADALADMAYWHEPRRIVAHARLAVALRPGREGEPLVTDTLRAAVPDIDERIDLVPMELTDLSATEIRAKVAAGEPTEGLLDPEVRALIDGLGLYRAG